MFSRFTNFSSTRENPCKNSKKLAKAAKNSGRSHKIHPAKRSEAEIQFKSDEKSVEKAKEFQPLDFAQRTDSRRIHEKVHEV
jgi:hypothetical protein